MGKLHGGMTAEEALRVLEADPEWRAQRAAQDAEMRRVRRMYVEAQKALVADLKEVGAPVTESVYDLVNTSEPYPQALPVLVKHLEAGGYPPVIMEGIGRALSVRDSVVFWDRLVERYRNSRCEGELTGMALALSACMDKAHIDDVIGLLTDESGGSDRIFFIEPLVRRGGERGRAVVEGLVDDPVVGKEATAYVERRRKRQERKARKAAQ